MICALSPDCIYITYLLTGRFPPFSIKNCERLEANSEGSYQPISTFLLQFPIVTDNIQQCRRPDGITVSLLAIVLANTVLLAVGKFTGGITYLDNLINRLQQNQCCTMTNTTVICQCDLAVCWS